MSDELEGDKVTANTRTWRLGGPMSAVQKKEAKALFIEELKWVHCVSLACEYAGISRKTVYQWREKDSTFADRWEDAVERSKDIARSSIYQRGVLGWEEPVVSMGQVVYEMVPVLDVNGEPIYEKGYPKMRRGERLTTHKWSDSLAALYAKSNLPEYREKQQIDLRVQMAEEAEKAKQELLSDLAASMSEPIDENQNQTHE